MKNKIGSSLQYLQYLFGIISVVFIFGFLIFSIFYGLKSEIIASSIFFCWAIFLHKKIFIKPSNIFFDQNFIYNESLKIPIKSITKIKNGKIFYSTLGNIEFVKLTRFYSCDRNYKKLKQVVNLNK